MNSKPSREPGGEYEIVLAEEADNGAIILNPPIYLPHGGSVTMHPLGNGHGIVEVERYSRAWNEALATKRKQR